MMGLHPCSVKDDYKRELEIVKNGLIKEILLQLAKLDWIFIGIKLLLKNKKIF